MVRRSRAVRAPGPEPPGRAARASSSNRSRRADATWFAESAACRRGVQPFFGWTARTPARSCSRSPTDRGDRSVSSPGRAGSWRWRCSRPPRRSRPTSTGDDSGRSSRSRTRRPAPPVISPSGRATPSRRTSRERSSRSRASSSTSRIDRPGTARSPRACGRSPGARWPATARSPAGSAGPGPRARSAGRSAGTRWACSSRATGSSPATARSAATASRRGAGARRRWT